MATVIHGQDLSARLCKLFDLKNVRSLQIIMETDDVAILRVESILMDEQADQIVAELADYELHQRQENCPECQGKGRVELCVEEYSHFQWKICERCQGLGYN